MFQHQLLTAFPGEVMALTSFFVPDMGEEPLRNGRAGWVTDDWELHRRLSAPTWFLGQVESTPASRPKTHVEKVRRRATKIPWRPGRAIVTPECASVTAPGDAPAGHPCHRLAFVRGKHVLVHRGYVLCSLWLISTRVC